MLSRKMSNMINCMINDVFLISFRFFSVFFMYILVGILVNKYGRNIEGREVLPNYSFWTDLPNLIKVCVHHCVLDEFARFFIYF